MASSWLGGCDKQLKQFDWIHEIACLSENCLHVAEWPNGRLQTLTVHPRA